MGRQSKVTCACVLSCVKHIIVARIAWVLTQGGDYTVLAKVLKFLLTIQVSCDYGEPKHRRWGGIGLAVDGVVLSIRQYGRGTG